MTSICMTQSNFQQHHHLQQQFQLLNDSNMLRLQQQQQQKQQLQNQSVQQYNSGKLQPIAPAPSTHSTKVLGTSHLQNIQPNAMINGAGAGPMLPKKKYSYANIPYGVEQLPSVARRNARERNRVKQVNNGFSNLRQHLPQSVINALSSGGRGASKKLSKVDTLRIAVEYIRGLQDLLDDGSEENRSSSTEPIFLMDDVSNDGYSSLGSPSHNQMAQHAQSYHSEASASPTPSFSDSDISIGGANNFIQPLSLEDTKQQQLNFEHDEIQLKFEPFDNYAHLNQDEQPDDEELLDYISLWQEQ